MPTRQGSENAAKAQQTQVERSAASAERSAKSSERSTEISGESLRLNRQIFQVSERASIHVKSVAFAVEPNERAKATIEIENVGRTTAKGTLSSVNVGLANYPISEPQKDVEPVLRTPLDLVSGDVEGSHSPHRQPYRRRRSAA